MEVEVLDVPEALVHVDPQVSVSVDVALALVDREGEVPGLVVGVCEPLVPRALVEVALRAVNVEVQLVPLPDVKVGHVEVEVRRSSG